VRLADLPADWTAVRRLEVSLTAAWWWWWRRECDAACKVNGELVPLDDLIPEVERDRFCGLDYELAGFVSVDTWIVLPDIHIRAKPLPEQSGGVAGTDIAGAAPTDEGLGGSTDEKTVEDPAVRRLPRFHIDNRTVELARLMKVARDRREAEGKDTTGWKAPQARKAVELDNSNNKDAQEPLLLGERSVREAWRLVKNGTV
jgi:hypothetical protein